jgi:hypothetical protein
VHKLCCSSRCTVVGTSIPYLPRYTAARLPQAITDTLFETAGYSGCRQWNAPPMGSSLARTSGMGLPSDLKSNVTVDAFFFTANPPRCADCNLRVLQSFSRCGLDPGFSLAEGPERTQRVQLCKAGQQLATTKRIKYCTSAFKRCSSRCCARSSFHSILFPTVYFTLKHGCMSTGSANALKITRHVRPTHSYASATLLKGQHQV